MSPCSKAGERVSKTCWEGSIPLGHAKKGKDMKRKKIKKITINNGAMFEGTVDMFKDCFFSNASEKVIRDWCEKSKYKVEFEYC